MSFYLIKRYIRLLSNNFRLVKKIYLVLNRIKLKTFENLPDSAYAKIVYYENTGFKLKLNSPLTFNEKLWWLKLNNRDPLLTTCSDKVLVRDYVRNKGLTKILIDIYGIYKSPYDIDLSIITTDAYIKCNHVSGINFFYRPGSVLPADIKRRFAIALKQNYYLQSREWNYKNIEPKLVVEKSLAKPGDGLVDYRFLCFDGKVRMIFVDIETAAIDGSHDPNAKRNVYDKNFNLLDVSVGRRRFDNSILRIPTNYRKMIEIAEKLSEDFVFCRVDLYNVSGQIYFGEMTFYPGGCTQKISPSSYALEMGSWLNLESNKIIHK